MLTSNIKQMKQLNIKIISMATNYQKHTNQNTKIIQKAQIKTSKFSVNSLMMMKCLKRYEDLGIFKDQKQIIQKL